MENSVKRYDLSGKWKLEFTMPETGERMRIQTSVPGNVESDLIENGLLDDIMPSDDLHATSRFDYVDDWTYICHFDRPECPSGCEQYLVFEGIDTIAEVYLNGSLVLHAESMHEEYRIGLDSGIKVTDNELKVIIRSALLYAREHETEDIFSTPRDHTIYGGQTYLRKARHEWGWDNAPRLLTSGIYRPVYLETVKKERFGEVYLYTDDITEEKVSLGIVWEYLNAPRNIIGDKIGFELSYQGKVLYSDVQPIEYTRGTYRFNLSRQEVPLWWPIGFGEAALCEIRLWMIRQGEKVSEWSSPWGIRTIKLVRTENIGSDNSGDFVFVVNNEKVYINGTNWKPTDALHSRCAEKNRRVLEAAKDLHCNMIRVWGGGIYEDEDFYSYCDENGIMVWQDMMFGCEVPTLDAAYLKLAERETEGVIRRLRNHAALAVWCGDNEDDECLTWTLPHSNILPSDFELSRKILKKCVLRLDPYRSYAESSPYASDENIRERRNGEQGHYQPEDHLYPATKVFSQALRNSKGRFIGETGPIAVNAMTDNERIFLREKDRAERLWNQEIAPDKFTNAAHQMDEYFLSWRLTGKELCETWYHRDFEVTEWKDYATAINIICGDVFKEVIEYCRVSRWDKTGVIWWSLYDMWPMLFNYSVIDTDFVRKMPYYWIRQSQQPFALMVVRKELDGEINLYTANDTLMIQKGNYDITAYREDGSQEIVASGRFSAEPNSSRMIQLLTEDREPELWIIRWIIDGKEYCNHFVTGSKHCSFECWKDWVNVLNRLYKV